MVRGTPGENSVISKSQTAAKVGKKKIKQRMNLVKTANSQDDPLASLPLFKTYAENGIDIKLSTKIVTDLDEGMKKTMMGLVETNMKKHFIKSKMGWDEKKITSEMFRDPTAWYLIAEESEKAGNIVGFSHFRFDMDCSCDEVLYVYDIQIDSEFQGKGLGNFMMTSLETIAFKAEMRKIMLTVFKHNPNATKFFKQYMKYGIDETSPRGAPPSDIYILSKQNNEKQAESLEAKTQNMHLGTTKVKGYTAGGKVVGECEAGG